MVPGDENLSPVETELLAVPLERRLRLEAIMRGPNLSASADGGDVQTGHRGFTEVGFHKRKHPEQDFEHTNNDFDNEPPQHGKDSDFMVSPGSASGSGGVGNRSLLKRLKTPRKSSSLTLQTPVPGSPGQSNSNSCHSAHSNTQLLSRSNQTPRITQFFKAQGDPNNFNDHHIATNMNANGIEAVGSNGGSAMLEQLKAQYRTRLAELEARESALAAREGRAQQKTENATEAAQQWAQSLQKECDRVQNELSEYRTRATCVIIRLLRELATKCAQEQQELLVRNNSQIGSRVPSHQPHLTHDQWEDGDLFKQLHRQQVKLRQEREDLDREKKALTARRRKPDGPMQDGEHDDKEFTDVSADIQEQEEILRLRTAILKRDQLKCQTDEIDLEYRRKFHMRFSRLLEEEKRSRFGNYPVLNQRYVALHLIGKGGFSEVFKAFDLVEHRYVACKIHQLNPQWSIERRRTYTRHASREYEIHKQLQHCRVVQLFDVFAIDDQCFCTILEYCDGNDLDMYLKQVDTLPERSARCIMLQIFSGLRYLNSQRPRIIHFDLKPGNILFSKGEIKIADFGLSKLLDDDAEDALELTSPGYGSYWYLPPEVFDDSTESGPATISSKVDVWSAGVIFYQMLFGKRPFGHELTAKKILLERTILNAKDVDFPNIKPPVSNEAKDFIRRCLSHRQADRPDVLEILDDPYLRGSKPKVPVMTTIPASRSTNDAS